MKKTIITIVKNIIWLMGGGYIKRKIKEEERKKLGLPYREVMKDNGYLYRYWEQRDKHDKHRDESKGLQGMWTYSNRRGGEWVYGVVSTREEAIRRVWEVFPKDRRVYVGRVKYRDIDGVYYGYYVENVEGVDKVKRE